MLWNVLLELWTTFPSFSGLIILFQNQTLWQFMNLLVARPDLSITFADNSTQTVGAMENWGLVMYRTTSVLFDEGTSDTRWKNYIAYVVAHGQLQSRPLKI